MKTFSQPASRIPTEAPALDLVDGRRSNGWSFASLLWWGSMIVLVYLFSTGPMVRLALDHHIPEGFVRTVYEPVFWVCETRVGEATVGPCLWWYGEQIWGWRFQMCK